MCPIGSASETNKHASSIRIPIRGAQANKRRDKPYTARVRHFAGKGFDFRSGFNKVHLVAKPLHDCTGNKNTAFERILSRCAAKLPGSGGNQPIFTWARLPADIHQQESTGAVGVFHGSRCKTGFAKGRSLLISGNACNRDRGTEKRWMRTADHTGTRFDARQHGSRNTKDVEQFVIPLTAAEVAQQRSGSIGRIGDVLRTAR